MSKRLACIHFLSSWTCDTDVQLQRVSDSTVVDFCDALEVARAVGLATTVPLPTIRPLR